VSMVFWIGLGLAVWLSLAVLVVLLVGKMIRQRDGQWHHLDEPSTARAHSQMAAHDGMTDTRPIELVRGAHAPPSTAMAAYDGMTDTRPVELVRGAHAPPTTEPEPHAVDDAQSRRPAAGWFPPVVNWHGSGTWQAAHFTAVSQSAGWARPTSGSRR
jgi:hypothetical protein